MIRSAPEHGECTAEMSENECAIITYRLAREKALVEAGKDESL